MATLAPHRIPLKGRLALVGLVVWALALPVLGTRILSGIGSTDLGGGDSVEDGYAFGSAEAGFRAVFPTQPEQTLLKSDPKTVSYVSATNRGGVVAVWYAETTVEPGREEAHLRALVDQQAQEGGQRVESAMAGTFLGHPSMDYRLAGGDGPLVGREVLVGTGDGARLYLLLASPGTDPERTEDAYQRLLETFRLEG